jgi:hypothetical protein
MSTTHAGVRISDPTTYRASTPAGGWLVRMFDSRSSKRKAERDFGRAERALVRPGTPIKGMGKKRAERTVGEATLKLIRSDDMYPYTPSERAPKTLTRKYVVKP